MPKDHASRYGGRSARRPGVVAVARAAGVSPSTVSNVYNRPHVVSEALRRRVLDAASQLGFAGADPAARNLRSGRTGAIGVVFREHLAYSFEDPAAVRFLQGVSEAADPEQLALLILPGYPEEGSPYGPAIRRVAIDGLILYSLTGEDPLVRAAQDRRLPTVAVDSPAPVDFPEFAGFDFVGIDEDAAAAAAVGHLLELGHRRLGIVSLRLSARGALEPADLGHQAAATASVVKGRLQGAARAAAAAGIDWETVPVEPCRISDVADGRASAHALLGRAPDVTALFAFSDPIALGARLAARDRGLSVPGDLSIVGFDDSAADEEGLTTVHQPLSEKGRIATQRLLRALAGDAPDSPCAPLATRLVVRASTAPPGRLH